MWAPSPVQILRASGSVSYSHISREERQTRLAQFATTVMHSTAISIGHIHCMLKQPIKQDEVWKLEMNLNEKQLDALRYVCTDTNRTPVGNLTKSGLVAQLVHWV